MDEARVARSNPPLTICLHQNTSSSATAASMLVELTGDGLPPVAWTSMATPCTGVFLPVTVGQPLPEALRAGDTRPSRDSAWWAMRELQHVTERDPVLLTPVVRDVWAPIEDRLLADDPHLSDAALGRLTEEVLERRNELIFRLTTARLEDAQGERTALHE